MAITVDSLSGDAVFSAEETLAALLDGQGVDSAPGTTIRELGIRPMAVLQAHLEAFRTSLVESLNIHKVASGEVAGDDAVLDALASTYRLSRLGGSASQGSLLLRLRSGDTTYINRSYRFYAGESQLDTGAIYVGMQDLTGVTDTEHIRYVRLLRRGGQWYMVIPVTCADGLALPTGTAVSITGDVSNIVSAEVYSPLLGGGPRETNQALARRILYGVAPGVLSTPLQLRGAFSDGFGIAPSRVAVFGSGSPVQRRDIDTITGLPLGGRVDVAVAPSGGCSRIEVTAEASLDGEYAVIQLPADLAAGAYRVTGVVANGVDAETWEVAWGVAESASHRVTASTARWSSLQTAVITLPAADIGLVEGTASASVSLEGVPGLVAMQALVDSPDRSAPGQDVLVRAPAPCFLRATVSVSGGTASTDALRQRIVSHLNALPVGRGYVSAQDITDALSGTGTSLNYPVVLLGTTLSRTGETTTTSLTGRLDAGVPGDSGVFPDEVVFFTDNDSIRVVRA